MPHRTPECLTKPERDALRPRLYRLDGDSAALPIDSGRTLRVVPELGPPLETRERWVASLRWSLRGVPPTYRQAYVSWAEALDVWSDGDPRVVLQLHVGLGGDQAGTIAFEVHACGDMADEAERVAADTNLRLTSLWRGLGAAWKWQPVPCEPHHHGAEQVELAEVFAQEEGCQDDWTFRPVRFQPGAVLQRLSALATSQQRMHYAVSFRPAIATDAEVAALDEAGDPAFAIGRRGFEYRIHLSSAGAIDLHLADLAARRLFGRSGHSGVLDIKSDAPEPGLLHRGGHVIHVARSDEQREKAWLNLCCGAMLAWEPTAAPKTLGRVRRLISPISIVSLAPSPWMGHLPPTLTIPAELPRGPGATLGHVGETTAVVLSDADAALHTYVIGKTGTGKSTLLLNLIHQRILEGHGVTVIDPHGDLANEVLACLPEHRVNDAILLDPSDIAHPIGLSLLESEPTRPEQKTFLIDQLFSIIDELYDLKTTGGPIFEMVFRNTFLALMDTPGATLADLRRFLIDEDFRKKTLSRCQNARVASVWKNELMRASGEISLANLAPYVSSKLDTFVGSEFLLPILGQKRSAVQFDEVMDQRKIVVVRLNKGRLGKIGAHLYGMLIVARLLMAAMARSDGPGQQRVPHHLFVDEFQNVMTTAMTEALAEARKYGLRLTLANQHLAQLDPELRAAVLGNVGNTVAFRMGPGDAQVLAESFGEETLKYPLTQLPNYFALARLNAGGKTLDPLFMRTLPAPERLGAEIFDRVLAQSRKLSIPREVVMRELDGQV